MTTNADGARRNAFARAVERALERLALEGGIDGYATAAQGAKADAALRKWNGSHVAGEIVADRGGIWEANDDNTNSRPVSGNAHWTLIGGLPYVDTVISGDDIQTLNSVPPELVPAPGADLVAVLQDAHLFITHNGDTFSPTTNQTADIYSHASAAFASAFGITQSGVGIGGSDAFIKPTMSLVRRAQSDLANLPILFKASTDFVRTPLDTGIPTAVSVSGASGLSFVAGDLLQDFGGDATATVDTVDGSGGVTGITLTDGGTVPYAVSGGIDFVSANGFAVQTVNTGTKTFTISGDHTARFGTGASFYWFQDPLPNPAYEGVFTVASSSFGAGATTIVVNEVVTSEVAAGTLNPGSDCNATVDSIPPNPPATLRIRAFYSIEESE